MRKFSYKFVHKKIGNLAAGLKNWPIFYAAPEPKFTGTSFTDLVQTGVKFCHILKHRQTHEISLNFPVARKKKRGPSEIFWEPRVCGDSHFKFEKRFRSNCEKF